MSHQPPPQTILANINCILNQNDGCDMNTCSDKPLLKQLFNPDNSKPQDSSSNNSNTVVSSGDISKEVASDSQTVNGEQQQIPRIKKTKSSFNAPCFVKKQEKSPGMFHTQDSQV